MLREPCKCDHCDETCFADTGMLCQVCQEGEMVPLTQSHCVEVILTNGYNRQTWCHDLRVVELWAEELRKREQEKPSPNVVGIRVLHWYRVVHYTGD